MESDENTVVLNKPGCEPACKTINNVFIFPFRGTDKLAKKINNFRNIVFLKTLVTGTESSLHMYSLKTTKLSL